jgi:hypothetical protein
MLRKSFSVLGLLVGLSCAGPADATPPQNQGGGQTNGAGFVPNGWCKGNGNPHAGQCPIFAPGSTAPNSHNSNQPVPTTNQLSLPPQQPTPPVIQVVPLPPQTISGFAPVPQAGKAPDVTGYSPGIGIAPNPPQVISGFSPGPQQIPAPSFGGHAPYVVPPQPQPPQNPYAVPQPRPPAQPPQVPLLKPGYTAYPDYVGPRDPASGYPVVTANPPQTITGYAPYNVPPQPVLPNPPQTITGYAPNNVPPLPPQQQTPTPIVVPQPQPYSVPTPLKVEVPRPRPLPPQGNPPPTGQTTVSVTPQGGGSHVGTEMIAAKSGRQAPTAVPVFEVKGTGDRWHCVASGHHVRKVFDDNGNEVYAGALPGVAIQVVPIIRDVPAWHDLSTECLISVREHPLAKAARR